MSEIRKPFSINLLMQIVLIVYASIQIILLVYLWINHVSFPLNLEAMELYILLHVKRLQTGLPIYVAPSANFIPFVYNPLYYFLSIPFVKIFGLNLGTLRLVAIIGSIGAIVVLFLAVKKSTLSSWWGWISVGLFAASYRAMDAYIDTAHADSWLLFMVLLGAYLIGKNSSRLSSLLGVGALIVAFWFKQHGAVFLVGSLTYLTWRDGLRKSWLYWIIPIIFGMGLYIYYPISLLGSHFHYYTWEVPRQWSQLDLNAIYRLGSYVLKNFSLLTIFATIYFLKVLWNSWKSIDIWLFLFPFAVFSALMASLDPENNNNVFIPMATWLIIIGVLGLAESLRNAKLTSLITVYIATLASFAFLFYRPATLIVSKESQVAYQDLKKMLEDLNGSVFAPWIGGNLQDGYQFSPPVHWVPIYDIVREPGISIPDHPLTRTLLEPVTLPNETAYILMNYPLEDDSLVGFLASCYVLYEDLGDRFSSLSTLPRRYQLNWPRYIYKFNQCP